jgi:hypothetical protein
LNCYKYGEYVMFAQNFLVSALLLGCSLSGASSADLGGGDGDDLKGSQRGHLVRPPSPTADELQKALEKAELKRKIAETNAAAARAKEDEAKADQEIEKMRAATSIASRVAEHEFRMKQREDERKHLTAIMEDRLKANEEKSRIIKEGSSHLLVLAAAIRERTENVEAQRQAMLQAKEAIIREAQRNEISWGRRLLTFMFRVDPGSGKDVVKATADAIESAAKSVYDALHEIDEQSARAQADHIRAVQELNAKYPDLS